MPDPEDAERFASTESHYADHRPGYPDEAIDDVADRFALDDDARILDLGCGTGQLALPLAARVVEQREGADSASGDERSESPKASDKTVSERSERHASRAGEVVAMDPDPAMLEQGRERASAAGIGNVTWVEGSDADLDGSLAPLRLTTMGRAFHWMDERWTLSRLYDITEPGGGVALFGDAEWLTKGTADWQDAVYDVVAEYLDDLPERTGPVCYEETWAEKLAASPFTDVETRTYEYEREWSVDGIVGYVLSLSFCAPRTFGTEKEVFERDLRARLGERGGPFVESGVVQTDTAVRCG